MDRDPTAPEAGDLRVCVSALDDDFEVWVDFPADTNSPAAMRKYREACAMVGFHLTANPPPRALVPCIHVETYPAEGERLRQFYGVGRAALGRGGGG